MFPVMLCVRGRRCLVVGGGGIAFRKVSALVADGADVTVVASSAGTQFRGMAAAGIVQLELRPYDAGEAAHYALVFAATDDHETNQRVARDAKSAGVWVNVADDPENCSFHLPARVRRGALEIAIGSSGAAPFAVRRLHRVLETRFGPEWAEWLGAAARFRDLVRSAQELPAAREELYDRFFVSTVNASRLAARVPNAGEVDGWLAESAASGEASARPRNTSNAAPPTSEARPGLVSLVGAGPGDPGLLTLRGRARLLAADAVVYDRLAAPALPCDLPPQVELHCVGKESGTHPVPQEEINALLVRLAMQGKRVVRLKGGDPFVFGRGGEEAEALAAAGAPFEVIPGVTAGVAAAAYAGIPVTHRGEASRVSLVTAHESGDDGESRVPWELMAKDVSSTIVGYMGVGNLGAVVSQLLAAGMAPQTPAAVVERGCTSAQRVVRSTVANLPKETLAAGIGPPAVFVIGPTATHAGRLEWFARRPLAGERLVLTEPAGPLGETLDLAGAETVVTPLPVTPAAAIVMAALPVSGFVLRDAVEVDAFESASNGLRSDTCVAWCIGERVAARARRCGWRNVEELDGGMGAESVVGAIATHRRSTIPA